MKYTTPNHMLLWEAVQKLAPDSSKTTLRQWVKSGRILVDGNPVTKVSYELRKGQEITLASQKKTAGRGLKIVYEDSFFVVVDKPTGMLSVATDFTTEHTAHALVKDYYNKNIHVVHRLDQDTSGVMLFALSERALHRLKIQFADHTITRCYTAVVEGTLEEKKGIWQSYLIEDENFYVHVTDDKENGQLAVTHYEVENEGNGFSNLKVTLETGKKNQIRVHCKAAGHSVVGDFKYGAMENPINRLGLHARLLALDHPITGKRMTFESPIPWRDPCTKTDSG